MKAFHKYMYDQQALALELYERGGMHPKELEAARAYSNSITVFEALFPELGEPLDGSQSKL